MIPLKQTNKQKNLKNNKKNVMLFFLYNNLIKLSVEKNMVCPLFDLMTAFELHILSVT